MQHTTRALSRRLRKRPFVAIAGLILFLLAASNPATALDTARFTLNSLLDVAPLVVPGLLLAAWVSASGAGSRIATVFDGNPAKAILAASALGALTPVCGVTVLPLMAGLLAAGVPLAPVMAFWLSSPVTDPAMFFTTAATLGPVFAFGKTFAAFALGLLGGGTTALLSHCIWVRNALRDNLSIGAVNQCGAALSLEYRIWQNGHRRRLFKQETVSTARLVLICLIPAFAAEYLLNGLLEPGALATYLGSDKWWAVPLAVFVGAPAYLDGYAALPLTRAFMDHGMSPGAAMAFLVSGGVVSIWGAMAIFPVLRIQPFLLYLAVAVFGSLATGWIYELLA